MLQILGVEEVVTAARSRWQKAYAERLIGSSRRECLDHVAILGEIHLLRVLASYYNRARCHLSLAGGAPNPGLRKDRSSAVSSGKSGRIHSGTHIGRVVELPEGGGLHHRYGRAAA